MGRFSDLNIFVSELALLIDVEPESRVSIALLIFLLLSQLSFSFNLSLPLMSLVSPWETT